MNPSTVFANPDGSWPASREATLSQRPDRVADLAAIVLLAGAIRPSELQRAAGRPVLDLPIAPGRSLGQEWIRLISDFRQAMGCNDLPLLVTANSASGTPRDVAALPGATVTMDTEEPRGSGGSLRDIAMDLDPHAYLLVASGHSFPRAPLSSMFARLAQLDDDIVIHTDADGHPTGVFLIRCGTLTGLPARGFVDLKEQALPHLATLFSVRIARGGDPAPIPIRSLHGYISALRAAARGNGGSGGGGGGGADADSPTEDWMCTFNLIEEGAHTDPAARLHDSIVLRGGRVGARASVVRSLVGPGGIVAPGAEVFDDLLPRSEQRK